MMRAGVVAFPPRSVSPCDGTRSTCEHSVHRLPLCGVAKSSLTEVGVMSNPRLLAGLTATAAIALIVGSCEPQRSAVAPTIGAPRFHFGAFVCTPFKMTGGGRIDFPPGTADKNPPASHIFETFGAHVIASGQTDANGTCLADKGALEWIDHRPDMAGHGQPPKPQSASGTVPESAT